MNAMNAKRKPQRETQIAKARRVLGDPRLLQFLRVTVGPGKDRPLACELINEELDEGRSLDDVFYTGEDDGYQLEAHEVAGPLYIIEFGCVAGPTAGDGAEWLVVFDNNGQIESLKMKSRWTA